MSEGLMPAAGQRAAGVRGWLRVLCWMLTVIGPAITVWLMADAHAVFAPQVAGSAARSIALVLSLLATTGAVLFGIYAGLRLWTVRPGAVRTAQRALLVGLAVDIVTAVIEVVALQPQQDDRHVIAVTAFQLLPSLIFFTVCFAYLQRSQRVAATYGLTETATDVGR